MVYIYIYIILFIYLYMYICIIYICVCVMCIYIYMCVCTHIAAFSERFDHFGENTKLMIVSIQMPFGGVIPDSPSWIFGRKQSWIDDFSEPIWRVLGPGLNNSNWEAPT